MADDEGASGPEAPKKKANRERILVGVGIVGLVLTFLLLRRSASSAGAAQTASSAYTPGYPSSGPGYYGAPAPTSAAGYPVGTLDPATEATLSAIQADLDKISASSVVPANQATGLGTGPTVAAQGQPGGGAPPAPPVPAGSIAVVPVSALGGAGATYTNPYTGGINVVPAVPPGSTTTLPTTLPPWAGGSVEVYNAQNALYSGGLH